jgi:hypothetical protein
MALALSSKILNSLGIITWSRNKQIRASMLGGKPKNQSHAMSDVSVMTRKDAC